MTRRRSRCWPGWSRHGRSRRPCTFPGRTFFRAVLFAPYVLGVYVIGLMWRYLLDGNFGIINALFGTDIQ